MLNTANQEAIQPYINEKISITLNGIKNKLVEQFSVKPIYQPLTE